MRVYSESGVEEVGVEEGFDAAGLVEGYGGGAVGIESVGTAVVAHGLGALAEAPVGASALEEGFGIVGLPIYLGIKLNQCLGKFVFF